MTKDEAVILIGIIYFAISVFVVLKELRKDEPKTKTNQDSENKEAQKENKPPVA